MVRTSLSDLGIELESAAGLDESTVKPSKPSKPSKPAKPPKKKAAPAIVEKEPIKEEDLVRITVRVDPDLEDNLFKYQRQLRKHGISKRASCFNAIITEAIEDFLKSHKI